MLILVILSYALFLPQWEINKPVFNFKTEFELDLDRDGFTDFLSLSSGKLALSSNKLRITRIQRFNPLYAIVKDNEIWLSNLAKALTYEKGTVILRRLSLKEQIWLRMYRLETWRANILTFNLLLTLITILISLEKIYRFTNTIIFRNFNKKETKIPFENIFWLITFLLFVLLLALTKNFLYVSWIWGISLIQYSFLHFLPSKKLLLKIIGLFLIVFVFFFIYLSYFGFWIPIF